MRAACALQRVMAPDRCAAQHRSAYFPEGAVARPRARTHASTARPCADRVGPPDHPADAADAFHQWPREPERRAAQLPQQDGQDWRRAAAQAQRLHPQPGAPCFSGSACQLSACQWTTCECCKATEPGLSACTCKVFADAHQGHSETASCSTTLVKCLAASTRNALICQPLIVQRMFCFSRSRVPSAGRRPRDGDAAEPGQRVQHGGRAVRVQEPRVCTTHPHGAPACNAHLCPPMRMLGCVSESELAVRMQQATRLASPLLKIEMLFMAA